MNPCPCGSSLTLADCCQRYISGSAAPPTAEALMRARYTSYATGSVVFIERTHALETREGFNLAASEKWARESEWRGLRILDTQGGGEHDTQGMVRFVAVYAQDGKEYHHEEYARFRKENGAWMFVDGKTPTREPFVKSGPDLGRNDPCHCGSGKKFKKCHGR